MKNNKIIILDFDRTLFNTDNFLIKIKYIFKKMGIAEKKFTTSYKKIKPYNLKKHLKRLNLENKNILNNFNTLFKNSYRFLYPDAIDFLKFLIKKKKKIILLTYGDKNFQNNKIENSNIKKLFNKIYITSKNHDKENIYKNILAKNKNKKVIIIDDLKENTKDIVKKIAHIQAIKIDRNSKNNKIFSKKRYYEVKNLDQIKTIISKL